MPSPITTLAKVKARLFSGASSEPTEHDTMLQELIENVCGEIETIHLQGRVVVEAEYVEVVRGQGTTRLQLLQGPLVSVEGVTDIEYLDDGAGGLEESETAVAASTYLPRGTRAAGLICCGWLERIGGKYWEDGVDYRVSYTAGWIDDSAGTRQAGGIPPALAEAATNEVCARFLTRDATGMMSKEIGGGDLKYSTISQAQQFRAMARVCAPFAPGAY